MFSPTANVTKCSEEGGLSEGWRLFSGTPTDAVSMSDCALTPTMPRTAQPIIKENQTSGPKHLIQGLCLVNLPKCTGPTPEDPRQRGQSENAAASVRNGLKRLKSVIQSGLSKVRPQFEITGARTACRAGLTRRRNACRRRTASIGCTP